MSCRQNYRKQIIEDAISIAKDTIHPSFIKEGKEIVFKTNSINRAKILRVRNRLLKKINTKYKSENWGAVAIKTQDPSSVGMTFKVTEKLIDAFERRDELKAAQSQETAKFPYEAVLKKNGFMGGKGNLINFTPSQVTSLKGKMFNMEQVFNKKGFDVTISPAKKDGYFNVYLAEYKGIEKGVYTVPEALNKINETTKSEGTKALIKELLKLNLPGSVNKLNGTEYRGLSEVKGFIRNGNNAKGFYVQDTGDIYLKAVSNDLTLLHEILHGVSYHNLRKTKSFTDYFDKVKQHLIDTNNPLKDEYGLSNYDEFFVALFTNPKVMQGLDKLTPLVNKEKYGSLWDEFIELLSRVFKNPTSLLKEGLNESIKVVNLYKDEQAYQESFQEESYEQYEGVYEEVPEDMGYAPGEQQSFNFYDPTEKYEGTTTAQAEIAVNKIKADAKKIHLVGSQNHYVRRADGEDLILNDEGYADTELNPDLIYYDRVTSTFQEGPKEQTEQLDTANKLGTGIDELTRDFFSEGEFTYKDKYHVTEEQFNNELGFLEDLERYFSEQRETVVSDDVTLFSDKHKVAGTVDLLTYDENGNFHIYDMKTTRRNFMEKYKGIKRYDSTAVFEKTGKMKADGTPQWSIVENAYQDSKRTKHQKQLSIYRMLLQESYGITAGKLGVVGVHIGEYADNADKVVKLELLKETNTPIIPITPLNSVERIDNQAPITMEFNDPTEQERQQKKERQPFSSIFTPTLKGMLTERRNELTFNEVRLGKIKKAKKDAHFDKIRLKQLTIEEERIKDRVYGTDEDMGLKDQIHELETLTPTEKLAFYMQEDVERLNRLVKSNTYEDIQEAKGIIRFYNSTFDPDTSTFFTAEQINSPDMKETRAELEAIYRQPVIDAQAALTTRERSMVTQTVNQIPGVKNLFGEGGLDEEGIFRTRNGLKDINFVTMFIQDPQFQFGLTSSNSVLPQIASMILENAVRVGKISHADYIVRLKEVEEKVTKALKKGFIGSPDYNTVFRSLDQYGFYEDSIVQRFTSKMFKEESDQRHGWNARRIEVRGIEGEAGRVAYKQLAEHTATWYKERYEFMDITQIPEILTKYPELFDGTETIDAGYTERITEQLGSKYGYEEQVAIQMQMVEEYLLQKELYGDQLKDEVERGILNYSTSEERMKAFERNHNPIKVHQQLQTDTAPNIIDYKKDFFVNKIPRKKLVQQDTRINEYGTEVRYGPYIQTEVETGYYNKRMEAIDGNDDFKEFHNLLLELMENLDNSIHPSDTGKMNVFSLASMERGLREILMDKTLSWGARFNKVIAESFKYIKDLFRENVQNSLSHAMVDPITNKPIYKVNAEGLRFNKGIIDKNVKIEVQKMLFAMDMAHLEKLPKSYDLNNANQEVLNLLAGYLNTSPNLAAISGKLNMVDLKKLDLHSIIKASITNGIVADQSLNLPKIMKTMSHSLVLYKARQEVLAKQAAIKDIYLNINNPKTTKHGKNIMSAGEDDKDSKGNIIPNTRIDTVQNEGKRVNAVKQYESWFQRAVLGDYSKSMTVSPMIEDKFSKATGHAKTDRFLKLEKVKFLKKTRKWFLRTAKTEADLVVEESANLVGRLKDRLSNTGNVEERAALNKKIEDFTALGNGSVKLPSAKAFIENVLFSSIRFLSLGYNLSSAMTNYAEGQFSNLIAASSGRYFSEENYWKAMSVVKASSIKNLGGLITSRNSPFIKNQMLGAELSAVLMRNYDVLNDSYNELQKAASESNLDWEAKFHPQEITNRIEYINQSPVMIAHLMEEMITDKEGNPMSLWDAMMENGKAGGKLGQLPERFRTPQNILNYENVSQEDRVKYIGEGFKPDRAFLGVINDTIVKLHGDYDPLRGNLASATIPGQALIMFKRWMGSHIYSRLAAEQVNIRGRGHVEKGRYMSLNAPTGAMYGAIAGFTTLGPLGAIGGAAAGLAMGTMLPFMKATKKETANLSLVAEGLLYLSMLVKRSIGIPVNYVTGRNLIDSNNLHVSKLSEWQNKFENKYDKVDKENIKANLTEMALLLWSTALFMMMKGLTWDDDDEKDSTRRMIHNVAINKIMGLQDQMLTFINPVATYKTVLDGESIATLRFLTNAMKTVDATIKMVEGDDTILSGVNAGDSRFGNQVLKTFAPSPVRDYFGPFALGQRQFMKSPMDDYYKNTETLAKSDIKRIKSETLSKWKVNGGVDAKQANSLWNELVKPKHENEPWAVYLERVENTNTNISYSKGRSQATPAQLEARAKREYHREKREYSASVKSNLLGGEVRELTDKEKKEQKKIVKLQYPTLRKNHKFIQ